MKKTNQYGKKLTFKKETIAALQQINGGLMGEESLTSRPTLTWVCHPPKPNPDPSIIAMSNGSQCMQTCGRESCGTACYNY